MIHKALIPSLIIFALVFLGLRYLVSFELNPEQIPASRLLKREANSADPIPLPKSRIEVSVPVIEEDLSQKNPLLLAQQYLDSLKAEINFQSHHSLTPEISQTPEGTKIKYQVYQGDIPIQAMAIIVSVSKNGVVSTVENSYKPVTPAELETIMAPEEVTQQLSEIYQIEDNALTYHTPIIYADEGSDESFLAYKIPVTDKTTQQKTVLTVRALDAIAINQTPSKREF